MKQGCDDSYQINFDAEGSINFKSLTYLPTEVPQNLTEAKLDQYRKGGIKIYVRKVLIYDDF